MGDEWTTRPLGELAERLTTKNAEGNSNVLTISAQRGLVNQRQYFNKHVASENLAHYYLLERGDFAYNKSYSDGYPVGAIKRLDKYDKGVVSPLYICFRAQSRVPVASDYLVHFFESGMLEREIRAIAKEGARNHGLLNVKASEFFSLPIVLPSLGEQRKIAAILSSVDDAIEAAQAVIDQLQVVKKAMMAELLTRGLPGRHTRFKQTEIGEVPEGWEVKPLSEIVLKLTDGEHLSPKLVELGYPILSAKHIRDTEIVFADYGQVNEADFLRFRRRCDPEIGDLLMVSRGATIGRVHLVGTIPKPFCLMGSVIQIRPRTDIVVGAFLAAHMARDVSQRELVKTSGSSAQQAIYLAHIRNLMVPTPPLDEQQVIANAMTAVDARLRSERAVVAGLSATKSALMSVLLTGEVRVSPDEAAA